MAAAHSQPSSSQPSRGPSLVSRLTDRANKLIAAYQTTLMEIQLLKKELHTPIHNNEDPVHYKLHQISAQAELQYLNSLVTTDPKDYAKKLANQMNQILQQGGINNEQAKTLRKDIENLKNTFKF